MISVITPSLNQLEWLRLAIASVADQRTVDVQHIIQDAGTPDLSSVLKEKLIASPHSNYHGELFVERDAGMYDAINRGLEKARGEICAYLNCDEQYLPDALAQVEQFFVTNPNVDVAFAHALIVDRAGNFIAFRKAIIPRKYHIMVSKNLPVLSCAIFFRRRIFEKMKLFFDPKFKDIGDAEWVMRMIDRNIRMTVLPLFTSTFTETEKNRNLAPSALREKAEMVRSAPRWAQTLRPAIITHHRFRRLLHGAYRQKPFSYSIYTVDSPTARKSFYVERPTSRWRR